MYMKNLLLITALCLAILDASAQSDAKIGLSASLQGSQMGIALPVRISQAFALVPAFELRTAQHLGTDFVFSVSPRLYLKNADLSPYLAVRAGIAKFKGDGGGTLTDYFGGFAFGAEYAISGPLSVGVEAQGNITKSDDNSLRFGNAGRTNFNTATSVYITLYF